MTDLLPDTLRLPALDAAVVRATLTEPIPAVTADSGCITGRPCLLQCGFFCALDLDEDDPDDVFDLDEPTG